MAIPSRSILVFGLWLLCACTSAPAQTPAQSQTPPAAQAPVPADTATAPKAESLSKYKLAAGDVISISVFGEDDMKMGRTRLTDAGTISYPVLGEIEVRGKTVGELEALIADGLRGRYLVNPRVSVSIDEYRPFFINGQVALPGSYPFQPSLTVAKAVTLAGGFTERASQSKIFLVREGDRTGTRIKVELNDLIHAGDIVTVEESFF